MIQQSKKAADHKIAVVFPGIGYHTDKPLLYYSKKLAQSYGYEIREVPYGNFPANVKGSAEKMQASFYIALEQAKDMLADVRWEEYSQILFLSKSIGTAVAAAYGNEMNLSTVNIYYTPVEQTFPLLTQPGIAFHGNSDPWIATALVQKGCEEHHLPLYITEKGNHSLETGDPLMDLRNMQCIMEQTEAYLLKLQEKPLTIRHAQIEDLPDILAIYQDARKRMKENGNPKQWGNHRPTKETVLEDLVLHRNYVVEKDDKVCGVFAFIIGEDPTYLHIEDGAWKQDTSYGTIHRIAGDGYTKGIFKVVADYCKERIPHLRIDTHADNILMQHAIVKQGFARCGIIHLQDGAPRIGYEYVR